jgi:hypothetical protein
LTYFTYTSGWNSSYYRCTLPHYMFRPHMAICQWLYSPLLGPGLFFSFAIFFTQSVRLLGRVTSPSQGLYLHTG